MLTGPLPKFPELGTSSSKHSRTRISLDNARVLTGSLKAGENFRLTTQGAVDGIQKKIGVISCAQAAA